MARTFDGPLTADDLVFLKARYPASYVERLKTLHGVDGKADSKAAQEKAEAEAAEAQAKADAEAAEKARLQAEEDLIGDTGTGDGDGAGDGSFDVLGATETEVKEWAASASDEDKASALATEQAREDRDPRKGVVGLLS